MFMDMPLYSLCMHVELFLAVVFYCNSCNRCDADHFSLRPMNPLKPKQTSKATTTRSLGLVTPNPEQMLQQKLQMNVFIPKSAQASYTTPYRN